MRWRSNWQIWERVESFVKRNWIGGSVWSRPHIEPNGQRICKLSGPCRLCIASATVVGWYLFVSTVDKRWRKIGWKKYIYISYNRGVFFLEGERKQKNVGELQSLRYRVAAQIPRKAVCASGGGRIPRRFLFRFLIRTRVFFLILPLLFSFSLSLQFFIFSFDDAQCQKVHSFLVSWMRWPFHYPVMNWKRVKE